MFEIKGDPDDKVIQIDPSMTPEQIGEALVAGVKAGDRLQRKIRPPRWWWQRKTWLRAREVDALERIAMVLEQAIGRRQ